MFEAFADELTKIAEGMSLEDISSAIRAAAQEHTPKKAKGTRGEPLHVKYGPEVHYGVGRYGTHLAVGPRGAPTAHLYRNRIYVGDARKGKKIPLSVEEQQRAARLIREYRRT